MRRENKMAEIEKVTATEEKPPVVEEKKPDNKAENEEITRLKAALSRANAEAAEFKRQYKATLDEAKQKEFDLAAQRKAELEELESLRKEKRISGYKARLMEAGIDAATADTMANALPEGVSESYFTATKTYLEAQKQAFETERLRNQPGLSVGQPLTGADAKKDEMNRMRKAFGLTPIK